MSDWKDRYAALDIPWRSFFTATIDGWVAIAVGVAYSMFHFAQPITSALRNPALDTMASLPLGYGLWRVSTTLYRWYTRTNGGDHPTIAAAGDLALALMIGLMLSIT